MAETKIGCPECKAEEIIKIINHDMKKVFWYDSYAMTGSGRTMEFCPYCGEKLDLLYNSNSQLQLFL